MNINDVAIEFISSSRVMKTLLAKVEKILPETVYVPTEGEKCSYNRNGHEWR